MRPDQTSINLLLVTGSPYKFHGLTEAVKAIPAERSPKLSIDQVGLRSQKCPVEVPEENGWRSEYLYKDKGEKTRLAMGDFLQKDEFGITGDVNPRIGYPGQRTAVTLTKYAYPKELKTYEKAEEVLAEYITGHFGKFDRQRDLLVRLGVGVVPWLASGIIGLVKQKSYIYYDRNPLPDMVAARDYLQYCAETHVDANGEKDNAALERNIYSAGGILNRKLIAWAVRDRKIPVEVYGRSKDAYGEIGALARGFTPEIMEIVLEMGRTGLVSESPLPPTGDRLASLQPNQSHKIIWSSTEQRCAVRTLV